jgi:hypothetical protein
MSFLPERSYNCLNCIHRKDLIWRRKESFLCLVAKTIIRKGNEATDRIYEDCLTYEKQEPSACEN